MKNKRYSLTAKERKELNNKDVDDKKKKKASEATAAAEQESGTEGADVSVAELNAVPSEGAASKRNKKKTFTIIIAVFMTMLLLTGIIVTILLVDEMNKPNGNPTATINLSNGKKLNFVLYEDTAPIAVTNFMYLSMKGFYDNTVIHDNQRNWLRFMGIGGANDEFESDYDVKNHVGYAKSEDSNYYKSFTGFENWKKEKALDKNIFWYRLRNDSTSVNFDKQKNNEGLLCFMYSYSSCLFQISCVDGAQTTIGSSDYKSFTVMGCYKDDATLQTLRELNRNDTTINGVWYNPNEVIKITSIKIKNYDKSKWEGKDGIFNNFDSHMEEINGYDSYASETYNYNRIR